MTSSTPQLRAYGSWPSPITPERAVAGAAQIATVVAEGAHTWWAQSRPSEAGRVQIVRRDPEGTETDLLPAGFNARTRVHEYGGGAWWVHHQVLFFTNFADQRLYRLDPGAEPRAITPEPPHPQSWRYADGDVSGRGDLVICVRERHEPGAGNADPEVINELVAISPAGDGEPVVIASGADFYAAARLSPDGARLAWLTWNHPDMPWDATTLHVGDLVVGDEPTLINERVLSGVSPQGDSQFSLLQPEWSCDGQLFVISDHSDWWNVYRVDLEALAPVGAADSSGEVTHVLHPLHPVAAEVGVPAWVFGVRRYVVGVDDHGPRVVFTYSDDNGAHLVTVAGDGQIHDNALAYDSLTHLAHSADRLVATANAPDRQTSIVETSLQAAGAELTVLVAGDDHGLRTVSRARRVSFPSEAGRTAHGLYYAPAGGNEWGPYAGLEGTTAPLVVTVHGGPTSQSSSAFNLGTQFWTSRGFAVFAVDYGGSTGYGRAYRQLLNDAWGVVDVQDAAAGARWLVEQGLADPTRIAITGGSAGGFTVLLALALTDDFTTGTSRYGVTDLAAMTRDTHKFESRYLDRLVGPWPQSAHVYAERSPLSHLDGFSKPLLILQGDEDEIVPPSQAEMIVAQLQRREISHAYLLFRGEQHGFRKAENILRSLTAELSFYAQIFGIELADGEDVIEPVRIDPPVR